MVTCNICRVNRDVEEFTKFQRICDDCWDECEVKTQSGRDIKELVY